MPFGCLRNGRKGLWKNKITKGEKKERERRDRVYVRSGEKMERMKKA